MIFTSGEMLRRKHGLARCQVFDMAFGGTHHVHFALVLDWGYKTLVLPHLALFHFSKILPEIGVPVRNLNIFTRCHFFFFFFFHCAAVS
jgi:hypothetical protein